MTCACQFVADDLPCSVCSTPADGIDCDVNVTDSARCRCHWGSIFDRRSTAALSVKLCRFAVRGCFGVSFSATPVVAVSVETLTLGRRKKERRRKAGKHGRPCVAGCLR